MVAEIFLYAKLYHLLNSPDRHRIMEQSVSGDGKLQKSAEELELQQWRDEWEYLFRILTYC